MSEINISLDFGEVNFEGLESDDDFRREAQRLLPGAIDKVGRTVAEVAWKKLQKAFSGPGFSRSSSSEKVKFIRETSRDYARSMSQADKKELEDHIVEQLSEAKANSSEVN